MSLLDDRLASLLLVPPRVTTPWSGHDCDLRPITFARIDGVEVTCPLPLFWYDPPWDSLAPQHADWLATSVAELDVIVSALSRDLSAHATPMLMTQRQESADESSPASNASRDESNAFYLPRMVPYRPERYGLLPVDYDDAKIIDVRLTLHRDISGRFAYSPEQIGRWEATPEDSPHSGGGYVPAGTFPPDVISMKHLGNKIDQLRRLSPKAAVFVSIPPFRLEEELSGVLVSKPDGVILRMDQVDMEPLQLAALTRRARKLMREADAKHLPLWIVPGEITPADAVKLIALGASGVAIDAWCDPIVDEIQESIGGSPYATFGFDDVDRIVTQQLPHRIENFSGLMSSLDRVPAKEQLGTFSSTWAKALAINALR
ncbi:beta/alpha barrel domain-containing protein [Stieleria varia]|uniref:Uncharacterized protein n=1 Tax=Stieleria varia TaxID=2528005 RepID=A0A5C6AZM6_9BACT|nr:hypothetical protein [Stieleria varia]TWU05505.1 hypothetical protein Pla52n_12190 [Stieleria varia]